MPCLRHKSVTTAPASASFKMPIICSSENCFRFIPSVPSLGRTLAPTGGKIRAHVIGQPVVTHELPYILDRAQLGAAWRQRRKDDVVGHDQFSRTMPSRLIEQHDSVCARRDVEGDLFQMHRHASLLQRGMTMPAPFPSAGQIAPKIHAEDRR